MRRTFGIEPLCPRETLFIPFAVGCDGMLEVEKRISEERRLPTSDQYAEYQIRTVRVEDNGIERTLACSYAML